MEKNDGERLENAITPCTRVVSGREAEEAEEKLTGDEISRLPSISSVDRGTPCGPR
jgi:hypothetical protein